MKQFSTFEIQIRNLFDQELDFQITRKEIIHDLLTSRLKDAFFLKPDTKTNEIRRPLKSENTPILWRRNPLIIT